MSKNRVVKLLPFSFMVLFTLHLASTRCLAQQDTAAIAGVVTDATGGAVVSAQVVATNASTGVTRQTETNSTGSYQFLSLPPGSYSVRVEAHGFKTSVRDSIAALVSTTKHLDFQLELGSISESISVTEPVGPAVNTTDATLGNAFDSRQILALPFEGRDAAGVLSLQPGISFIGTNVDDSLDTRNGALNGGRSDQANITLDGVDNNQQLRGTAFQGALRSTLDSIEERWGSGWNRFTDTLLGGWQITGLLRWSSALPFSLGNAAPGGTGPFPTDFQLPGYPTLIGPLPATGLTTDSNGDPNVFKHGAAAADASFRFDYAGEPGIRNALRGQGYFGSDAGVNKTFALTERQSLRFSAYAFNFTNSVRFDARNILNSFPQLSTLGKYTGTLTTSRRLEFVLRYQF